MTIAVRVSMWILGTLVVVTAAVAGLTLMQKQTLQGQNQSLHNQITSDQSKLADLTTQVKKLEDGAEQLTNQISQAQQEKTQLQNLYDDLKHKSDDLQSQLDQANSDRDDWKNWASTVSRERDGLRNRILAISRERDDLKNRVSAISRERDDLKNRVSAVSRERDDLKNRVSAVSRERDDLKNRITTISRERDSLIQKLKNPPVKIVYKEQPAASAAPASAADVTSRQGDEYWASVLKQKAALQIEIQKEKSDLSQAALQVVELKKQNSDLGVALKQISNEKDEIIQKIKYGQDLADNLSVDLARSHNDQQAVNDRADKLKKENLELLSQIRGLSSIKLDLEKTVARLTDEKDGMQKKLIETGSVIQSRIDDIWKIKEGLDKKLSENTPSSSASGSMELPPIIVNAPNNQQQAPPAPVSGGKNQGSVISINEANNFVIADLGKENSSVNIGTVLKVYRNSKEIATLEVIQVRRDICAGDIKDKSGPLKVGDIVRFN